MEIAMGTSAGYALQAELTQLVKKAEAV